MVVVAVAAVVIGSGVGVVQILISLVVTIRITCLRGKENACRQRVRTLTAYPGLQERDGCRGVIHTVRTGVDGEGLTLTLRYDVVRFLVEEVLDGEVGELQSDRTYQTRSTPTERELYLVAGFGLQVIRDIHRSVLGVRLDIRH